MNYSNWILNTYFKNYKFFTMYQNKKHILLMLDEILTESWQFEKVTHIINDRIDLHILSQYSLRVILIFISFNSHTPIYTPIDSPRNMPYVPLLKKYISVVNFLYSPLTQLFASYYNVYKNIATTFIKMFIFNVKWILLAGIISFLYFFISLFYIQIDFAKQLAVWYVILVVYYLLMSTFNSFLNKYKYGKFTSAIQRFWKRTGMIFWLLEGFLFILFFYYFLNSSQEPLYMFDYSNLNQELLIQLKTTYKNMILLSLAIFLSFILLLNMNFYVYYQNIILLSVISLIIFYTLYIESYQFVYIITLFADKTWIFDETAQIWTLEVEQNNLRVKQQYFVLCLVAKYWHFIFIFISWFFFLIKSLEAGKINITLLGYNVQNLLILYVLNLMCLIQWIKYLTKKFFEITYYWFYIQYDEKFFYTFLNELWVVFSNYLNLQMITVHVDELLLLSSILCISDDLSLWKYII